MTIDAPPDLDEMPPDYDDGPPPPPIRRPAPRSLAPPHDIDAEEGVIGAMLYSLDACDRALEAGLEPEHFYDPTLGAAYRAACAVLAAGDKPDPITVRATMDAATAPGDLRERLARLLVDAPLSANVGAYVRRLQHTHRLRTLQGRALAVAHAAQAGDLEAAIDELGNLTAALPEDDTTSTWSAVDLTAALDGDGPPAPTILARDDGQALLYAGKVHAINAESESGKSWLALKAIAEQLLAGHHGLYIDFEDDATGIVGRLIAQGVPRDIVLGQLHYLRPDDPIDAVTTAALERILLDHQPTIAIIDGVTEVMAQNGWSISDNDDAAKFLLALPRRIARHGPAVVLLDHVVKDKEGRGRYGIGAAHKLAGLDGAAYHLEVTAPFGLGRTGTSRITVTKDRPGHVRGLAIEGRFIGELRLQSLPDGAVHLSVTARAHGAEEPQVRPTSLMDKVSKSCEEMNQAGVEPGLNQLVADIPGKRTFVLDALRRLVDEHYIEVTPGPNRSKLHRSLKPYRAALDPRSDTYAGGDGEPPSDHDEDF